MLARCRLPDGSNLPGLAGGFALGFATCAGTTVGLPLARFVVALAGAGAGAGWGLAVRSSSASREDEGIGPRGVEGLAFLGCLTGIDLVSSISDRRRRSNAVAVPDHLRTFRDALLDGISRRYRSPTLIARVEDGHALG
jgi:hypothetical protein